VSPFTTLRASFCPNSNRFPAFPRTMGRTCGWRRLTMRSSQVCVRLSSIPFCCRYSSQTIINRVGRFSSSASVPISINKLPIASMLLFTQVNCRLIACRVLDVPDVGRYRAGRHRRACLGGRVPGVGNTPVPKAGCKVIAPTLWASSNLSQTQRRAVLSSDIRCIHQKNRHVVFNMSTFNPIWIYLHHLHYFLKCSTFLDSINSLGISSNRKYFEQNLLKSGICFPSFKEIYAITSCPI